jgi:hypothetical protein
MTPIYHPRAANSTPFTYSSLTLFPNFQFFPQIVETNIYQFCVSKRKLGEGFMKDILTILLASAFVLFSLIVLLSAARTPDRTSSTLNNDQKESQISDSVLP